MLSHYAVIGHPIGHSLSPAIHQSFAKQFGLDLRYEKIEGDPDLFEQQVKEFFAKGGKGLNITLPFKERAYAMADVKTQRATMAKAANTFWMEDGQLQADNTDGAGLVADLQRYIDMTDKRVLLLGAGGAARGVLLPLLAGKPGQLLVANRTLAKVQVLRDEFPSIATSDLTDIKGDFDLVINATSISFSSEKIVLPEQIFRNKPFCYDLAYSLSEPTAFVAYARRRDCQAVDGLGMLVEQAARAFEIWHGLKPELASVLKQFNR